MFAGPNGSGKSTLKEALEPQWLGVYVNADDIERSIREHGNTIDLGAFGLAVTQSDLVDFFARSGLIQTAGLQDSVRHLSVDDGRLAFGSVDVNSYHAAVLSDFIRQQLLAMRQSVSFETVMSGPDKIDLLCAARRSGYRTYLYFVATDDPAINIERVAFRVEQGGHGVPRQKVIERYERSLAKLMDAIRCTDRAYIFDNTGDELVLLAEITGGQEIELKVDEVPHWFARAVLAKLSADMDPE